MPTSLDIIQKRLHNQRLTSAPCANPEAIVQWLGAIQAQDYAAAKWAIGLRVESATDASIEQAFNDGVFLRTHILRPTWHFVLPADIHWLLALTSPQILKLCAPWYRKLGLDEAFCQKSNAVLIKALEGGKQLMRSEIMVAFQQAGIEIEGERLNHLMMKSELDGILCSGGRKGQQFTYALLAERAPQARVFSRAEALAELAKRYFNSHGPATLKDFAWWSGLTLTDARNALEMITFQLQSEKIHDQIYWFAPSPQQTGYQAPEAYLLPNYDEYTVGYTDRSAIFDLVQMDKLDSRKNIIFQHAIVIKNHIVGTWKRTLKKEKVIITPTFFAPTSGEEREAFNTAANRYATFLGLHPQIDFSDQES